MAEEVVLVVNPGSTSTKIGIFDRQGCRFEKTIRHPQEELRNYLRVVDQFDLRYSGVKSAVEPELYGLTVVGVVGRGGPLKPLSGGVYRINERMLNDLGSCKYSDHASNLGAIIADRMAVHYHVPAYVVDPVTVDDFIPEARISGLPQIERKSRSHALNIKATALKAANQLGKLLEDVHFVVAHLGGGISICALRGGKIIDVNDALLGMGPFSPERAGALPIGRLVELAFSGEYKKDELLDLLAREGGLKAYLGTGDLSEVVERIKKGDQKAKGIFRAMVYQIAKEIGAMAAVLKGQVDGVVITGGMTHCQEIVLELEPYISFLGKLFVFPGEEELEAMAEGGFRALDGKEEIKDYI